jgi:hypothetical protein
MLGIRVPGHIRFKGTSNSCTSISLTGDSRKAELILCSAELSRCSADLIPYSLA